MTAQRRAREVGFLLAQARNLECAAVIAVSNMGKSDLLRLLKEPEMQRPLAPDLPPTTAPLIPFDRS